MSELNLNTELDIFNKNSTSQNNLNVKQSTNSEMNSHKPNMNSNTIFSFSPQDDYFYYDGNQNEDPFTSRDSFCFSANSILGDSNFFSYGDNSIFLKNFDERQTLEDDTKSVVLDDLELNKIVNSLEEDDEKNNLNDAKLSVNSNSNWSSVSNLFQNSHNKTTPIPMSGNFNNQVIHNTIESENTNLTSTCNNPSSLLTNNMANINDKKDLKNLTCVSYINKKLQPFNLVPGVFIDGGSNNITGNLTNFTTSTVNGNYRFYNMNLTNRMNFNNNLNQSCVIKSNSVDFHNMNLNPNIYYNPINKKNLCKNLHKHNKFQQLNNLQFIENYYNRNKTRNQTINNNYTNFSEVSSQASKNSINAAKTRSNREEMVMMMKEMKEQNGSKKIQKKIEEKSQEYLYKLYEQMKNNLFEIITDQYGNYVIQRFCENCDKSLISRMLNNLYSKNDKALYEISINSYGTRAFQKMLENLSSSMSNEDVNIILKSTKGNVLNLIKDTNGNYVIQSIVENIKNKELLSPIYKEMNENIINISTIKNGSLVFTKVLSNITEPDLNSMVEIILNNIDKLINDSYGNIIIQKIIALSKDNYNNKIFSYIKDKIVELSCQKYSSTVIEACISTKTKIQEKTLKKLIENNNINRLIIDQFGNYIVQKALASQDVKSENFHIIIEHIKQSIKILKTKEKGSKIYDKLMKNYKEFLDCEPNINSNNNKNNNCNNKSKLKTYNKIKK